MSQICVGAGPLVAAECLLSDHDSARTIFCEELVARFPKIGASTITIDSIRFRSVGLTVLENQAMC